MEVTGCVDLRTTTLNDFVFSATFEGPTVYKYAFGEYFRSERLAVVLGPDLILMFQ